MVLKGKYTILTLAIFAEIVNESSIKAENELLNSAIDQKENEKNYQNNETIQLDNEVDTLNSISESCTPKTDNFERLNGKEIKLAEDDDLNSNKTRLEREIQPISSPTNDNAEEYDEHFKEETTKHLPVHLDSIKDSESISSIEELKNEPKIKTEIVENEEDSDLEPISPDQNDQQLDEQLNEPADDIVKKEQLDEVMEVNDIMVEQSNNSDLIYISNLTEKVSDDEMCDFNNDDFDTNENSMNQRLESRASTANSEDLEAISSEEEYFEDVAGSSNDGELFVDYSDDEINQINFINEFNSNEYSCRPLRFLNDPSLTNYENLKSKNKINENRQLVDDIFYFDKQDKDSKWIEFIDNLDLNSLDLEREDIKEVLIEWVKIGVDFELALNQKNTAFKVRHIKSGLKLLGSLVQTNSKFIKRLLDERILEVVYKLFFKPYMTFPIKLLLIRTLDLFTDNSDALGHILNFKYKLDDEFNQDLKENLVMKLKEDNEDDQLETKVNLDQVFSSNEKTIYELLLILMMKINETRVTVALGVLLRKIHLYEFLLNFKENALNLLNDQQNQDLIDATINNLNEITNSFRKSKELFGQRLRFLPAKTQFDFKPSLSNIVYAIYNWFNHLEFLNLIVDLCANFEDNDQFLCSILNFLNEILIQEQGTSYFLSSKLNQVTNRLLQITYKPEASNTSVKDGENNLNEKLSTFNLNLKYNLYILDLIDQINEIQFSDEFKNSQDENELCLLYNKLYSMTFNELGSRCLVKQFCDNRNLEVLIMFLVYNKERNDKAKLICYHYAINLLIYVIQHSKDRLCDLLIKYNDEFINLSSYSSTLSKWLSPLKRGIKFNYSETTFKLLVSNLKQHSERLKDLKENCTYRASPDLICCVRILHYLCIDPNSKLANNQQINCDQLLPNNQLKYKYGLIQLFTLKGTTYILTILERLAEIFLRPSHLNSSLIGNQGHFLINLFKPCINILKETIFSLTHSRNSEFKDISPIKPLLKVYSLMLVFPLQSTYHLNSVQICNEVITILHSYTQLNVNINEVENEVFNKSIWTKMVKEVIDFTTLKPFNFSHGLYLLSQLLPLPLNVKQIDDANEIARLLNISKLWSAHLHVLFSDIENMLQKLVLCLSPLIQCLLRRVCYQLIDLSSHAGVIISKCLLSVLDQNLGATSNKEISDNLISVLDLISYLLKYNLFKNAFTWTLNTLNSSVKKDEKLDKTIKRTVELFKINSELSKKYSNILDVLDSKKEQATDEQLDLTQMEKLNLYYNNREETIELEDDLEDLKVAMDLNKRLTKYDLTELTKKYVSDSQFNVRNRLLVLYKNEEPNYEENYKLISKHKHEPLITKDYSGNVKRPYVAPLRGRGFQRGSNSLGRLHDPFRSRPPNTSRPPSMHVDDFVAMENNHQQGNSIKRQKQDFNKFNNKLNQGGQRTNIRQVYYNYNKRINLNNRNTFNRFGNIQTNYNNGNLNQPNNKLRKQFNDPNLQLN